MDLYTILGGCIFNNDNRQLAPMNACGVDFESKIKRSRLKDSKESGNS